MEGSRDTEGEEEGKLIFLRLSSSLLISAPIAARKTLGGDSSISKCGVLQSSDCGSHKGESPVPFSSVYCTRASANLSRPHQTLE